MEEFVTGVQHSLPEGEKLSLQGGEEHQNGQLFLYIASINENVEIN